MSTIATASRACSPSSTPPTSLSGSSPCMRSKGCISRSAPVVAVHVKEASTCGSQGESHGDLCLATKGSALVCIALLAYWLVTTATEDAISFYLVAYLLSFVYGGEPSEASKVSASSSTALDLAPRQLDNALGKVVPWLVGLDTAASSTTTESHFMLPQDVAGERSPESHQDDKEVSAEEVGISLGLLFDLFDPFEDHNDVLVWMNSLAGLYQAETPLEAHVQHVAAAEIELKDKALGELEQRLAQLMQQHAYPTFNEGNLDNTLQLRYQFNLLNIFCDDHESDWDESPPTEPGRSACQDAADIDFIFLQLKDRLSQDVLNHLQRHDADFWYKYRSWFSGANVCLDALVLRWHDLHSPPGTVKSLQDVIATDIARVRRFTPECPAEERHSCGLDSWSRPYLSGEEDMAVNWGSIEYNMRSNLFPELSKLQKYLKKNATYAKPPHGNPVLGWLDGMHEDELLNADAFEPCSCGVQAVDCVAAYRSEAEVNYHPSESCFSEFPLVFVSDHVYDNFQNSRVEEASSISRFKKLRQICKRHITVTDSGQE